MAQLPKITIITPSYNQGQFLGKTIESVLSQNYPNVEFLVMDGGSTDNSVEILRSYGKKIQWVSEKDKGQTDALIKGIARTSGEIIGYLNSDDLLKPGSLEAVGKIFQENSQVQWITGDYEIIDAQGNRQDEFVRWYKRVQREIMSLFPFLTGFFLGINNPIIQPSTFWRRSLYNQVGGFKSELRYTMDYDLWLQFLEVSQPKIIPQVLSQFRIHGQSKGGSQFLNQFREQWFTAQNHRYSWPVLQLQKFFNFLTLQIYSRQRKK